MKSLKITALSFVLVLLLAACGAKNDTPDEPAVDPTPEMPTEQPVERLVFTRWRGMTTSAPTGYGRRPT